MARTAPVNALIVDDDRSTQRFLADALKKQGFEVTVERDGEWALQTFAKRNFDVVLLDLLLPAINGYEVAKSMRATQRGRRVPIIFISGVYKTELHHTEAIEKHGAFALLEKPIDLSLLTKTLKKALGDNYPQLVKPEPPPPPVEEDEVTGEFLADDAQRIEIEIVNTSPGPVSVSRQGPAIRGDLQNRSFPEVLAELYRWRATGALFLRRNRIKKIVYLKNGTAELVKSNLLVECLGQVLVREKMISEAECETSLKRMRATKRMQGTVLIEMGCISPHNLQYALQRQLQEKLFDVFRWESGEYQFKTSVEPPPEPVSLNMTTAQLILEGVKQAYNEKRISRALGKVSNKYVYPSNDPLYALQEAGLSEEELEILVTCDGHKTVGTLRALGVIPPLDFDRLIFAMKCAQMIELRDAVAPGKATASIAKIVSRVKATPHMPRVAAAPPPLPPAVKRTTSQLPLLELPWTGAELARPVVTAQPMSMPRAPEPPPPPAPSPEPPRPLLPELAQIPRERRESAIAVPVAKLLPELSEVLSISAVSNEESRVREQLAGKLASLRRQDFFEVLGVRHNASREEVKRAYFSLAKEFHPDRHFASASAETRAMAQEIYDLISQAHDTLAAPSERERYMTELKKGTKAAPEQQEDVGRILAAEGKFQRGEEFMRQRNIAEAHKHFSDAIGLYEHEGEFHAWYGWSLFQLDASRAEEAIGSIERAIALNPRLDKSYLFLGYIYKASGRPDKAEKQFERAIQCNPDCTEALRELRLLGKSRR